MLACIAERSKENFTRIYEFKGMVVANVHATRNKFKQTIPYLSLVPKRNCGNLGPQKWGKIWLAVYSE